MLSGFDLAAPAYDSAFTHTPIGKMQRNRVHRYLVPYLNKNSAMNILELNCGTGEDAVFMSQMGHSVHATDISREMLARARHKAKDDSTISFQQLNINDLNKQTPAQKLDIIFSNFGGLNCISPVQLQPFFKTAADKLVAGGLIIAVIMPRKCLWERLYFLLKGKPKTAFRRTAQNVTEVPVSGKKVKTWYYNPGEISKYGNTLFSKELVKPIGFLIPPSYLNSFFRNKKGLLQLLGWMEQNLFSLNFLSPYADHFIIVLQKK